MVHISKHSMKQDWTTRNAIHGTIHFVKDLPANKTLWLEKLYAISIQKVLRKTLIPFEGASGKL